MVELLLPKQVVVSSILITRSSKLGTKETPNAMSGVYGHNHVTKFLTKFVC